MTVLLIPVVLMILLLPIVALVALIRNILTYKNASDADKEQQKNKLKASILLNGIVFVLLAVASGVYIYFVLALAAMT